MLCGV